MAKRSNTASFKGKFLLDTMEIEEVVDKKTGAVEIFDVLAELKRFDECEITLMIKEEFPIETKSESSQSVDDGEE